MPEIIVYNFIDLRDAITGGLYDKITLGSDITYSSGIRIPNNITELTIDGLDPVTGERHIITDRNTTAITDTIYIDTAVSIARTIIVKNIIANIRNYYGIIGVYESSITQNVILKYINIDFNGVQAFYNRYGKCILEDSILLMDRNGSISVVNEVAETRILELGGKVDITSRSTSNSTFWFPLSNSTFTVIEGAQINIYTTNRELIYTDYPIDFILQPNCKFNANCNWGMFYSTGNHQANLVSIGENSQFYFQQRIANGSIPTVRCRSLVADSNSDVLIRSNNSTVMQITISGGSVNINNPKRFALYTNSGRALHYSVGTGTLTANAQQFNYWQTAADPAIAGGINDFPLQRWLKKDKSNVSITANITNTVTTILSSNIIVPEDSDIPINSTTYPLHSAPVLSYGRLAIGIDTVTDNSEIIRGCTDPQTDVKILIETNTYLTLSDDIGIYQQKLDYKLKKGTQVSIIGANSFLYALNATNVVGSLRFLYVPENLIFQTSGIPTNKKIIKRKETDWAILVKDTRNNGVDWTLYGQISEPLHTPDAEINNGLIMIENSQIKPFQVTPIKIYQGAGSQEDEKITSISWSELEGILVEVVPDYLYKAGTYQTNITWTLATDLGEFVPCKNSFIL